MKNLNNVLNLISKKNFTKAEVKIKELIKHEPKNLSYKNILAIIYIDQKKIFKSIIILKKIIKESDKFIDAYINLGNIYFNSKNMKDSEICFKQALSINNKNTYVINSLNSIGDDYARNHQYFKAKNVFEYIIKKNKKNFNAYYNLACILDDFGEYGKAIINYKKSLQLDKKNKKALFNLSLNQIRKKQFKLGWAGYELRNSGTHKFYEVNKIKKENIWNGKKINEKIIVYPEQGIGDEILYSSMYNDLIKKHQNLQIYVDDRLVNIYQKSFKKKIFYKKNSNIKNDLKSKHILASSLGGFFRNSIKDFKSNKKEWLFPDKTVIKNVKKKFLSTNKIKVGISWKSTERNIDKNIPLQKIISALPSDIFEIISLQYGDVEKEKKWNCKNKKNIIFFNDIDYKNDFETLCAIIYNCKFVVTVSNATAHLAGALGKETFALIPTNSFWYWGNKSGRSLWYPRLHVIKQKEWRNWDHPLDHLNKIIKSKYI